MKQALGTILVTLGLVSAAAGFDLASQLSSNTLLYLQARNFPHQAGQLLESPLWTDKEGLRPVVERVDRLLYQQLDRMGVVPPPDFQSLWPDVAEIQLAISAWGSDGRPSFVVALQLSDEEQLETLWESVWDRRKRNRQPYQGAVILGLREQGLFLSRLEDQLLVASNPQLLKEVIGASDQVGMIQLADHRDFKELKHRYGSRDLWLYLNVRGLFRQLRMADEDALGRIDQLIETRDYRALALGSRLRPQGGAQDTVAALTMSSRNQLVPALESPEARSLEALRYAPASARSFAVFGIGELTGRLEQLDPFIRTARILVGQAVPEDASDEPADQLEILGRLRKLLGESLLQQLGSDAAWFTGGSSVGVDGPLYEGVLVVELGGPEAQQQLDRALEKLNDGASHQRQSRAGTAVYSPRARLWGPPGLALARHGNHLLVAQRSRAISDSLKAFEGESLATTLAKQLAALDGRELVVGIRPSALVPGRLDFEMLGGRIANDFLLASVELQPNQLKLHLNRTLSDLLVGWLAVEAFYLGARERAWACRRQLDQVGRGLKLYYQLHQRYPERLEELQGLPYLGSPEQLYCPHSPADRPVAYRYFGPLPPHPESRFDEILAACPRRDHQAVVLYASNRAGWVEPEEYQELLENTLRRLADVGERDPGDEEEERRFRFWSPFW